MAGAATPMTEHCGGPLNTWEVEALLAQPSLGVTRGLLRWRPCPPQRHALLPEPARHVLEAYDAVPFGRVQRPLDHEQIGKTLRDRPHDRLVVDDRVVEIQQLIEVAVVALNRMRLAGAIRT